MTTTEERVCIIKGCYRTHTANGFCDTHYHRLRRGIPMHLPVRAGTQHRILDLLETDGGWMTKHAIADRLRLRVDTAHRTLFKLRRRGLVASRQSPSSDSPVINEWRAL